jgi:hypothetical protein
VALIKHKSSVSCPGKNAPSLRVTKFKTVHYFRRELQVRNHGLAEKLLAAGIRSIINLQTPGEHHACGPGLLETSGFSYDPQDFMAKGIFFYNVSYY